MSRKPTHPGEILREDVLPSLNLAVSLCAKKLGVSRQHLYKVLREEAGISPELALRLGQFLGNGPDFWLRMQQKFDLWEIRQNLQPEIEKIIPVGQQLFKAA
jgi:addiction module HigA family antidote